MASTINPSSILDGLNVSDAAIRTQFTNAATDVNNLQAPQYVTLATNATLSNERVLTGTTSQITITDGGAGAAVTLTISNNPILPGTGSVTVPIGTLAQRPGSPVDGMLRYNSDTPGLEARVNGSWVALATGGVTSVNSLTGALTFTTGTSGTDVNVDNTGTTITLNIPSASATNRGLVTTGGQTFAGNKTFSGLTEFNVASNTRILGGFGVQPQSFAPVSGDTIDLLYPGYINIVEPAGTLATLTTRLPDPAFAVNAGFLIRLVTTKAITSLTVSALGAGATVLNPPTSLPISGFADFMVDPGVNRWLCVGSGSLNAAGVSSLNSLTGALSIATGTAGTDFAVSASGATVTLDLPSASGSNRGVVTTGSQTLAGTKTFSTAPILSSLTASRPLKLDASNNITATQITLSSSNDVTGTLAIGNGGTGSATQNFVDLTTGQTVAGVKTFSSDLNVTSTGAVLVSSGTTAQRPTATNGMIRYNTDTPGLEARVNGSWVAIATGGGSGVSSVNSLTGALTFTTGTSGTDVNVDNTGTTITLNIPSASAANRGLITTGSQTLVGIKTFNNRIQSNDGLTIAATGSATGRLSLQGALNYNATQLIPSSGDTVAINTFCAGYITLIRGAATLATLTITLPDPTTLSTGTMVKIATLRAITALTINSAGSGVTIFNAPTTLAAGASVEFMSGSGFNEWARTG